MRFVALFLLAFSVSCAAHRPQPLTFGFHSVQCVAVREVVCVDDADYPTKTCIRDVSKAIEEVNAAVGHPVFHFKGVIKPEGLDDALTSGVLPVLGFDAPHLPDPRVLALTLPKVRIDDQLGLPCIVQVAIGVSPTIAGLAGPSPYSAVYVLAHELVHALGAGHAPDGFFVSRMEPIYTQGLDHCFTDADKRTLRTVYGN